MKHYYRLVSFLTLACTLHVTNVQSSGFQLFEGNALNVGDFGSGAAAQALDASIGFYNPAGLVYIDKQFVLSQTLLHTNIVFTGDSKVNNINVVDPEITVATDAKEKGGGFHLIPAMHFATPINENFSFGLGVTVPFGLATEWSDTSSARYTATKSQVRTVNVGPAIGYKLSEQFSIGGGLDLQYMGVSIDSRMYIPPSLGGGADGRSKNRTHDIAFGWNAGVMWVLPKTSLGVHLRSQVRHHLKGKSKSLTAGEISEDLRGNITLPATFTFSATRALTQKTRIKGTAIFTTWKSIKEMALQNVATPVGPRDVSLVQNFRNTWRLAVGFDHQWQENLMLRAGVGFDQSPVNSTHRNLRLPDSDRYVVATGLRYQHNKSIDIDMGYTHIFAKKALISHTQIVGSQSTTTTGQVKQHADLLALQLTWHL